MPAIVVHAGAADRASAIDARIAACVRAAQHGLDILRSGGRSLDAVAAAVEVLEDDPSCNAGTGAVLTAEGTVELDACIMDGETLRSGAVGALPPFRHPIRIARAVLEQGRHHLLVAEGADRFAREQGFQPETPQRMITPLRSAELQRILNGPAGETVGAAAVDAHGRLAAGTSTGGLAGKVPGRIGDTALVGAGTYATDVAACSCTGTGEAFARACAAFSAVSRVGSSPQETAESVLEVVERRFGGAGGIILLAADGGIGIACSPSETMPYAIARPGQPVIAEI